MLFEKLLIDRIRSTTKDVTITTGIAFNHKMLEINNYKFIEIADDCVVIEGPNFNAKCNNWAQLEFIFKAVR